MARHTQPSRQGLWVVGSAGPCVAFVEGLDNRCASLRLDGDHARQRAVPQNSGVAGIGSPLARPSRSLLIAFCFTFVFLRPLRGWAWWGFTPRVPLHCTLGYDPAPLRGSASSVLRGSHLTVIAALLLRVSRQSSICRSPPQLLCVAGQASKPWPRRSSSRRRRCSRSNAVR